MERFPGLYGFSTSMYVHKLRLGARVKFPIRQEILTLLVITLW